MVVLVNIDMKITAVPAKISGVVVFKGRSWKYDPAVTIRTKNKSLYFKARRVFQEDEELNVAVSAITGLIWECDGTGLEHVIIRIS